MSPLRREHGDVPDHTYGSGSNQILLWYWSKLQTPEPNMYIGRHTILYKIKHIALVSSLLIYMYASSYLASSQNCMWNES